MKRKLMMSRGGKLLVRNALLISLLVLLFSLGVISLYNMQIKKTIEDEVTQLNRSTLEKNITVIDEIMMNMRELAYTAASAERTERYLIGTNGSTEELSKNLKEMEEGLKLWGSASDYVCGIALYDAHRDEYLQSRNDLKWPEEWKQVYDRLTGGRVSTFFYRRYDLYPYLIGVMCPVRLSSGAKIGAVLIDVNVESLGNAVIDHLRPDERFYIVDEQGRMILSTPYRLLGEREALPEELAFVLAEESGYSALTDLSGEKYVISCIDSDQENWRFILACSYDSYKELTGRMDTLLLEMILLIAALGIVTAAVLAVTAYRPVSRLLTEATAQPVSLSEEEARGLDEVERIILTMKHARMENTAMRREIDEQIRKFSFEQVRALQNQMDPHFLYNALDTLRWAAIEEKGEESDLSRMAEALADFFHISLQRSNYLVPLRDELRHVELFMQMYRYRYQNRLQIRYHVLEELLDRRVLKLSVQPMVDNAIKHGLRPRRYVGVIDLYAEMENGCLLVRVENDGVPMEEEALLRLNRELASCDHAEYDNHIGLPNINRRIRLLFGEGYGISVGRCGTGMATEMRLPASGMEGRAQEE